jgi:hypothetical protein
MNLKGVYVSVVETTQQGKHKPWTGTLGTDIKTSSIIKNIFNLVFQLNKFQLDYEIA